MSWAEVNKIDEGARFRAYNGLFIIESPLTWTVPKSGYYKVIAVGGAGANAKSQSGSTFKVGGGGAGGVAVKTMRFGAGDDYIISISSGDVYFDTIMTANGGVAGTSSAGGAGGTATGGDYNYTGNSGSANSASKYLIQGASVGCNIPDLLDRTELSITNISDDVSSATTIYSGYGILGHGAGGSIDGQMEIPPQKGCVIIIPYIGI